MLFSYGYEQQRNLGLQKLQANWWQFWSPCRRVNTAQCASPNGVHPWLHAKPLDAAIRQVPEPYCPGGCHGQQFQMKHKNTNKTQLLASKYHTFYTCNRVTFGTQNEPSTQLTNATSCVKCEMPQFELKSLPTFLAIKRCQQTKIQKLTNHEQSLSKKLAHVYDLVILFEKQILTQVIKLGWKHPCFVFVEGGHSALCSNQWWFGCNASGPIQIAQTFLVWCKELW